MSIVTFWSNENIETGQTMSMASVATYLAIEHNFKILMINTAFNDPTIEDGFWQQNKKRIVKAKQDIATGLKGLVMAIPGNKDNPGIITNYTKIIFKNRLELLTGDNLTIEEYERQQDSITDIIALANKYYDYVFVDLKGSIEDDTVSKILEMSNVNVINLTQRLRNINNYLQLREEQKVLQKNNTMILIGNYNPRSAKYTTRNIARYMKEKQIYNIPFNNMFFESSNEGLIADFFIKFRKIKNTNPNVGFMESTKEVSTAIINKIKELQMRI